MITLHIKKGEYIYLNHKTTRKDSYKILLVECDSPSKGIEIGLLDCRASDTPTMQILTVTLGKRYSIFHKTATINALKYEHNGINFALNCDQLYYLENDFTRRKKLGSIKKSQRKKQGGIFL